MYPRRVVDNALLQVKLKIWNSDQVSQFTTPQYLERLRRSVKYEEVYLHEYANPKEAYP